METAWRWESEHLQAFWKFLRAMRKDLGTALEFTLETGLDSEADRGRLVVALRTAGLSGEISFPVTVLDGARSDLGYGERHRLVLPLDVALRSARGLWSGVTDWTLRPLGDTAVLCWSRDGRELSLALQQYTSDLTVTQEVPLSEDRYPEVEVLVRTWLRETGSLVPGFRPSGRPDMDGMLCELELEDAEGRRYRMAQPDRDVARVWLRLALIREFRLQHVEIPVRWNRLGGLMLGRQLPIPGVRKLASVLQSLLARGGNPVLRLQWRADGLFLLWDTDRSRPDSGVRIRLRLSWFAESFVANHDKLLSIPGGVEATLAVPELRREMGLLGILHRMASAPKPGTVAYAESVRLADRGGRLEMDSGAFLYGDMAERAQRVLEARTQQEREVYTQGLSRALQRVTESGSRDLAVSAWMDTGGVRTEVPVEERGSSARFGEALVPLPALQSVVRWSSRKHVGLELPRSAELSSGARSHRMVLRETALSESVVPEAAAADGTAEMVEGKRRKRRASASSTLSNAGIRRVGVLSVEDVPDFVDRGLG
jgi:hypothetical protein